MVLYIISDLAASTEVIGRTSDGSNELLGVKIKSLNLVVLVVYRPPGSILSEVVPSHPFMQTIDKFSSVLEALPTPTPNVAIMGDFNLPKATWPQCVPITGASQIEKSITLKMADLASQHFLEQVVLKPTHRCGNTLDLLFTNNTSLFLNHVTISTSPVSSHYVVEFTTTLGCDSPIMVQPPGSNSPFDRVNLMSKETNWDNIADYLRHQRWQQQFEGLSPTEMLESLIEKCENTVLASSPKKKVQKRSTIPRHRRALMRSRTKNRKRLANATNENRKAALRRKLVSIESQLQSSYKSLDTFDEERAIEAIKVNPKYFYSYSKKKLKLKSEVGPLADDTGDVTAEPEKMASLLANQFESAFSTPRNSQIDTTNPPTDTLSDMFFNEEDIKQAIGEVSGQSAPGPDRFPALLLRNCREELAHPLCLIWRASLDSGEIPSITKTSVITPIYKKGDKQQVKNYRPVALTYHLIKIFEKVVRNSIIKFIESRNLLNPNQHGFRSGRSCLTQLVQFFDQVTRHLEDGDNVDVVYLDFAKAFDKVDFFIALQKIFNLGIAGKLFRWIECFLTGRKQLVYVNGAKSMPKDVLSGVPQGSVLGPLIFLVLLGDIDTGIVSASVSSFADDTRILAKISSPQSVFSMQQDLETIYQWSETNNMEFNANKFECMRYGTNELIKTSTSYFSNSGSIIETKDSVTDLGIMMSSSAYFGEHISKVAVSAGLKSGWILRTFASRSPTLMLTLWKSLVLPDLDYCCQLWSPSKQGDIQKLENIQMSFLKKIAGMSQVNYWDQLSSLRLYSIQRRQERYVAIYMWKIIEGLVPDFGVTITHSTRHGRYCVVPHVKSSAPVRVQNIRFCSLSVRGPRIFNALPKHVRDVTQCSVDTFKRAVDNHLQQIIDQPRVKNLIPYCSQYSNSIIDMKAI